MTRAGMRALVATLLSVGFLFLALLAASDAALADAPVDPPVARAVDWLRTVQRADGHFPAANVADAILGLAAAGVDPHLVRQGTEGATAVDALAASRQHYRTTAHWEMGLLAVIAAGEDPRAFRGVDYEAKVREGFAQGQFGDVASINDDVFGILALRSLGAPGDDPQLQAARAVLLANQNVDGGWSSGGGLKGTASGADMTGLTLLALVESGVPRDDLAIRQGLAYLHTQQDASGGFRLYGKPNTQSTAWSVLGLVAAGEDPAAPAWKPQGAGPWDFLRAQQTAEGGFRQGAAWPDAWATSQALIALTGASYVTAPVAPLTLTLDPPVARAGAPVQVQAALGAGRVGAVTLDLGDGTRALTTDRRHTYASPGDHTVTATVRGESGARGYATATLRVLPALEPALALSVHRAHRGERVLLDAGASTDPSGGALAYLFDFGDGNATAWSPDPRAEHAYAAPGTYTARVTVRGAEGGTATVERTLTITNRAPTAQLTGPAGADRVADARFTALALDPEGDALTYTWRVDGIPVPAAGPELSHRFTLLGDRTVQVTVTDRYGATATASWTVPVANLAPRVHRAGLLPAAPREGEPVRLDAEATDPDGTPPALRWRIDGGAPSASPDHAGLAVGTRRILVEAVDADGAVATLAFDVTVAPRPRQESPPEPEPPAPAPPRLLAVHAEVDAAGVLHLRAEAANATRVRFTLEVDGNVTTLDAPAPAFALQAGPFAPGARLRVTATIPGTNESAHLDRHVPLPPNRAPVAVLTVDTLEAWLGDRVTFTWLATDPDGDALNVTLTAGNATVDALHAFPEPGNHTVALTATDPAGASATATVVVHVKARPAPPTPTLEEEPVPVDEAPEAEAATEDGNTTAEVVSPTLTASRKVPSALGALLLASVVGVALLRRRR